MIAVEPATLEDFEQVYGRAPERSFQGFAVRSGGRAIVVCGLYQAEGLMVAFSQTACPVPKRAAVLVCRKLVGLMRSKRAPVFALRDESLPTSGTLLEHLGFVRLADSPDGGVYQWLG